MKANKEYPATHSMYTSWFAVDDEGCVALIEIEDDGPVPFGKTNDMFPDEITNEYWIDKDGKYLYDTDENKGYMHVDELKNFPSYAYHVYEGGSTDGADREACPEEPLKTSDFYYNMNELAWHIPGRFKDKKVLQLMKHFPCKCYYDLKEYVYDGKKYTRLKDEDGIVKYMNLKNPDETISETMMSYLEQNGDAEPYDFRKHSFIDTEQDD